MVEVQMDSQALRQQLIDVQAHLQNLGLLQQVMTQHLGEIEWHLCPPPASLVRNPIDSMATQVLTMEIEDENAS